jgi:hypothetical protein
MNGRGLLLVLASLLAVASVGLIWLGTQIVDQSHGPDPGGKLVVAAWLESEVWLNPWLVGLGLIGGVTAVLLFAVRRRTLSAT